LRISAAAAEQYRALRERAGILVREDLGRIVLCGADRKTYLQGLLSNDIAGLRPGEWCYATLLTAHGRMIADMRVFDLGEIILMDLARAVAATVFEHLNTFVIAEEVVVENATDVWGQVGVYGPEAASIVGAITGSAEHDVVKFTLPSDDLGVDGKDLIVNAVNVTRVVEALERAGALRVDPATAEITRIEAGIPKFLVDMDAHTIPLEAGIEDRAISMTKGCYVGQEVIVRVLHRGGGRVARKLVGLSMDGDAADAGSPLFAGDREVGRITSAAYSPSTGKRIALGYVHRDFVEPGTALTVRTAAGDAPATVRGKLVNAQ
jgi:tRNA-modifying protein YgfZ